MKTTTASLLLLLIYLTGTAQLTSKIVSIPKGGNNIPAIVYTPSGTATKYPLFVFLHGVGETGDGTTGGIEKLSASSNHAALLQNAETRKFMVLAPQFVLSYNDWRREWSGGTYVRTVIQWAKKNLSIDTNRIVLTGLSGGGGGTWDQISLLPEYAQDLAAAIPICGTPQSGPRDWSVVKQTSLPVWAFHARDDGTISHTATISQVTSINSFAPNPVAQMTIYDNGGHGIWGRVYSDPKVYEWALSQKRSPVKPPEPVLSKVYVTITLPNGKVIIIYEDGSIIMKTVQ